MPTQPLLLGKIRSQRTDRTLGVALAAIAGAINAGGFSMFQHYTSHMTGIASSFAERIGLGDFAGALPLLLWYLAFMGGAMVTTTMVIWGRLRNIHSVYAFPLLLEAFLLSCLAATVSDNPTTPNNSVKIIALLCFVMGLQNAVITKISEARIRTTHITGMTTDIGIALARLYFFKKTFSETVQTATRQRLVLHLALVGAFIGGGVVGIILLQQIGFLALSVPACYLILLGIKPLQRDHAVRRRVRRRRNIVIPL